MFGLICMDDGGEDHFSSEQSVSWKSVCVRETDQDRKTFLSLSSVGFELGSSVSNVTDHAGYFYRCDFPGLFLVYFRSFQAIFTQLTIVDFCKI